MHPKNGLVVAGRDVILSVELAGSRSTVAASNSAFEYGAPVALPNPSGLHARPAAVLAAEAKKFSSDIRLMRGEESANAKSVVAIMGLSTRQNDLITVSASGPDARPAINSISRLLSTGCGEEAGDAPEAPAPASGVRNHPADANELAGVSASPGLA